MTDSKATAKRPLSQKAGADSPPTKTGLPVDNDARQTAVKPGQRWRPSYGGPASMTRIVLRITQAGVVYREAWPSDVTEAFDRWTTWNDWVSRCHAVCKKGKHHD